MADSSSQDKNLPASQRKQRKAREEGQVVRSRDLAHFAVMAAGGGAIASTAPWVTNWLKAGLAAALRFDAHTLSSPTSMGERLAAGAAQLLWIVLPLGLLMIAVAVAGSLLAGGWVWSIRAMAPQFSRINPLAGLPRMLSLRQFGDAGKSCLLATVLLVIGAICLRSRLGTFSAMLGVPLPAAFGAVGQELVAGASLIVLALGLFAAVDVPLQRHLHLSRLKMSRQELKDELRQLEGNQEVKGRIKGRMRETAKRRMLSAVPKASLVVMNPTHYAVALKYEDGMNAPRVVAKGADLLAMKIRAIARDTQVPVLQAPMLARALYAHADIDHEIPMALYSAVAQVMAYVYQLRAALAGRAPMPGELPEPQVPVELDPLNESRHRPLHGD